MTTTTVSPSISNHSAQSESDATPSDIVVPPPSRSLIDPPPDDPLSGEVSTTSAFTDLLESLGVLAAGVGVVLLFAVWWAGLLLIAASPVFLYFARKRRARRAIQNENDLRAPQYAFSAEQITAMKLRTLEPGATSAIGLLKPDQGLSRWQLDRLLRAHMGDSPAEQALPIVLGYAHRLRIKDARKTADSI